MSDNDALRQLVEMVLADKDSEVIRQIAHDLPEDNEEAVAIFCDRFELGSWLYEALTLRDTNIELMISEIADKVAIEEQEESEFRQEVERDYRQMQDWPL